MKAEATKFIQEWDEAHGTDWSNCSMKTAAVMASFAKTQLEQLLSDLDSLDSLGVSWDRNHLEIYEHYHSSDYIKAEDLKSLIESWRAKL
jgi:hypothetical protein